jgi:hypothetical protein
MESYGWVFLGLFAFLFLSVVGILLLGYKSVQEEENNL